MGELWRVGPTTDPAAIDPDPLVADTIDPAISDALAELETFRRVLDWRRPKLVRALEWLGALDRDEPAVGEVNDQTIDGPGDDLPVRIYWPPGRSRGTGSTGTIVFFHGGGFVLGSIRTSDDLCRHLCRESGHTVVSVGYRLAPEHPFPAAVEDAYRATEWAGERIAEGPVTVAGDSAGGNLAAVVALAAHERDGPPIERQLLAYPAVAMDRTGDSIAEHAGLVLTEGDLEWFGEAYAPGWVHERNPYLDPVRATDLGGVAPATILTAGYDPIRDAGLAYARRLAGEGVSVLALHAPDQVHGFLDMDVSATRPAIAALVSELRGE